MWFIDMFGEQTTWSLYVYKTLAALTVLVSRIVLKFIWLFMGFVDDKRSQDYYQLYYSSM